MSQSFENTTPSDSKKLTKRLSRRRIMLGGSAGLAGIATVIAAGRVQANTQQPVPPETGRANPSGRFANKVVLITGATSGIGEATARAFALFSSRGQRTSRISQM